MRKRFFVSGIGTGVGKTIVSAIIAEALQADYWKPIQSGLDGVTDTEKVKSLLSNKYSVCHPESYKLNYPASPHKSADLEGKEIDTSLIVLPETNNNIVIEGAGGLMVPLNYQFLIVDLIKKFNAEVILVSQNYLGSINHTLLSLHLLKERGIFVKLLVFNGGQDEYTERAIKKFSGVRNTFSVNKEDDFTKEKIISYAKKIATFLN